MIKLVNVKATASLLTALNQNKKDGINNMLKSNKILLEFTKCVWFTLYNAISPNNIKNENKMVLI